MKKLTLTTLRQQIFQIADEVLMTGQPISIERNGKVLLLSPAVELNKSKGLKLKRRKLISGDAESLHTAKVREWREPEKGVNRHFAARRKLAKPALAHLDTQALRPSDLVSSDHGLNNVQRKRK